MKGRLHNKLVGLYHWWKMLGPIPHNHWCTPRYNDTENSCKHAFIAWSCTGTFCLDQSRKNCPSCESRGIPKYGRKET